MKAIVADLGNSDGMSFVPADINSLLNPALLAPGQYVQNEQLPSGYGKTFDPNWKAPEYVSSPVIVESAAPALKPVVEYPVLTADEFRNRQRYAESAFNNRAVSGAGAKGAYQIMPSVLSDYIKAVGKEGDLFDYEYNKGVRDWYVDWLLKRSAVNGNGNKQSEANKWAKVAAAYNWGLGNLQKYLVEQKKKGVDIYNSTDWVEGLNPETRDYVKFVALQQDTTGPRTNEAFNKAMSKYNLASNGGRIKTLAAKLMEMGYYSDGGTIHIDPSKRGTFKAQATKMGMGVKEAAHHILAHKDNYSSAMVKKANFAANFAADGGTLLRPYNKFEMGGPEGDDGGDVANAVRESAKRRNQNIYRRVSNSPWGLAYDALNAGLYLAAPVTSGLTLPFAMAMSGAQGAGALYDMAQNGVDANNAIDVISAIPGLGLGEKGVKALAKKGVSHAITKGASNPFGLMKVARSAARVEPIVNHALNGVQILNDVYDMSNGEHAVPEYPPVRPRDYYLPNKDYLESINPGLYDDIVANEMLKGDYMNNYRTREWSSGSIPFKSGDIVSFDYGVGKNFYGGARVPVEILQYIFDQSAENEIPLKSLLGLAGAESTLGYGFRNKRPDLSDSISPLRLFNYDHGIGQSDYVKTSHMNDYNNVYNKYKSGQQISEEELNRYRAAVDLIREENAALHDYQGENFMKDMWGYYTDKNGLWNKRPGFKKDVMSKGEEAYSNPALQKWMRDNGWSIDASGVAIKKK